MSIEISSDDSDLSVDLLPEVALSVSSSKSTNSIGSTSTVKLQSEDKENLVDLTQSCDKDEVLVLSGSSTRSLREIQVDFNGRSGPSSVNSDSTIELNTTELDADEIYDQMCQSTLSQKTLSSQNCITYQSTKSTINLTNIYDNNSNVGVRKQETCDRIPLQKSLSCTSYLTPIINIESPIRMNTDDMFDQLYKSSSQRRSIKPKRNSIEDVSFIEIKEISPITFNNTPKLPKDSNQNDSRNVKVSTELLSDKDTDNGYQNSNQSYSRNVKVSTELLSEQHSDYGDKDSNQNDSRNVKVSTELLSDQHSDYGDKDSNQNYSRNVKVSTELLSDQHSDYGDKDSNQSYSINVKVSTKLLSDKDNDNDDILSRVKIGSVSVIPKTVVSLNGESSTSFASSSSGYVSDESRKRKAADKGKGKGKKTTDDAMSKKQKLAEEKRAKQLANEMNKVYKPGECMKYMTLEADAEWLERWELTELKREAAAAAVTVCPITTRPGVIRFSRGLVRQLQGDSGMMQLSKSKEHIDQALFVQTAEEIAPYVLSHTLANHVAQVKEETGCSVTLVVFGVKDYYKSAGRKKTKNGVEAKFNDLDLEMAFTDVLVRCACAAWRADGASELALLALHYTRAVAEAPHKLAKRASDEQAEFYMRGDNKKCVAVDKDGHGISQLWQQMLAVLPKSSLEVSRAVCAQYPSPLALYESLQEPNAINNLADVGVDRAGLPGARNRRLGPEFAHKLATLFTADDGDMLLD